MIFSCHLEKVFGAFRHEEEEDCGGETGRRADSQVDPPAVVQEVP